MTANSQDGGQHQAVNALLSRLVHSVERPFDLKTCTLAVPAPGIRELLASDDKPLLEDARLWLSSFVPVGLGLETRLNPETMTICAKDGVRRIHDLEITLDVVDRMDPATQEQTFRTARIASLVYPGQGPGQGPGWLVEAFFESSRRELVWREWRNQQEMYARLQRGQ